MSEKYKDKFRIPSARLQTWEYGSNGIYFITICIQSHKQYFGKIECGEMLFSEAGMLGMKYWSEIPSIFPFTILDEFVVMPNHIHGILIIDKQNDSTRRDAIYRV